MGRPKAVSFKTFHLYDKLHTKKTKMYSGVTMTTLYPIKETKEFYLSPEVWAYCASKFKIKKKNLSALSVDISTITDQKTIDFLNKKAWHDWVAKDKKTADTAETIALLNRLFPDKKKVFFYELNSILSAYNNGTFVSYDDNGNVEAPSEHQIENRKYYTHKYHMFAGTKDVPEIKKAYEAYDKAKDGKDKDAKFEIYHTLSEKYAYENFCLDDVFINIGTNAVCYPVAFSHNTAEWSKEKYGKLVGYAHAGEIFFVVTPDTVYFEITRHF